MTSLYSASVLEISISSGGFGIEGGSGFDGFASSLGGSGFLGPSFIGNSGFFDSSFLEAQVFSAHPF